MSLRCTTHFHACDCREEKFKLLEQRLKEAEEVIGFYSNENNYSPEYMRQGLMGRHGKQMLFLDGGKRARAYFEKYGEKETNET